MRNTAFQTSNFQLHPSLDSIPTQPPPIARAIIPTPMTRLVSEIGKLNNVRSQVTDRVTTCSWNSRRMFLRENNVSLDKPKEILDNSSRHLLKKLLSQKQLFHEPYIPRHEICR